MVAHQYTITKSVQCQGVGAHSGQNVSLSFHPLPEHKGIVIERSDLTAHNRIQALWDNVSDTRFCTTLSNKFGTSVRTIEHVMAALAALNITNILIRVDAPEFPIMDGSAAPFIQLLRKAGLKKQAAFAKVIKVLKPIHIRTAEQWVCLEPCDHFEVRAVLDFKERQGLQSQTYTFQGSWTEFEKNVSNARTFGFYEDAEKLYALGLAKGSSLENSVVIDQGKVLNPEGLRSEHEMVKHKVLDAVGDLYLAGAYLKAAYSGHNMGHGLNNQILHQLFATPDAWTYEKPFGDVIATHVYRPLKGVHNPLPSLAS